MNNYKLKQASRIKGDAKVVGGELTRIKRKNYGILKPEVVVREAKKKKSPLHGFFEWDDGIAAEKYRIDQARHLIRSVVIEWENDPGEVIVSRAFVSIKTDEEWGYVDMGDALSDEEMREQVLESALKYYEAGKQKFAGVEELAGLFSETESLREVVKGQSVLVTA